MVIRRLCYYAIVYRKVEPCSFWKLKHDESLALRCDHHHVSRKQLKAVYEILNRNGRKAVCSYDSSKSGSRGTVDRRVGSRAAEEPRQVI